MPATIQYFSVMVLIRVYLDKEDELSVQRVFEQEVEWNDSIRFPIELCLRIFRALYGKSAIIRFDFY